MDCVTPPAVDVFHGLIAVGFVGVGTILFSLILNLFGTRKNFAGWLRRNGVFSLFSGNLHIKKESEILSKNSLIL